VSIFPNPPDKDNIALINPLEFLEHGCASVTASTSSRSKADYYLDIEAGEELLGYEGDR